MHYRMSMFGAALGACFALQCVITARQETFTFEKDKPGRAPSDWIADVTGSTKAQKPWWTVGRGKDGQYLAQMRSSGKRNDFPVCLKKGTSFKNGTFSVRLKPISGKQDQAGGIVFRAKDKDNFYVVRANAKENNVSFYYTKERQRTTIKYWEKIPVELGQWHTLKVEAKGFIFKIWLNDKLVAEIEDTKKIFPDAGMVGVWTKADSVTHFDDLTATTAFVAKKEKEGMPADTRPIRVGPEDFNSTFGYYGTTPESPDGLMIAYVKLLQETKVKRTEKVPGEIWVCNSDLSNHRRIISINPIEVHNGARVQWVDNQTIAYSDDKIRVVDLAGTAVITAVYGRIGHHPHNGKIIYAANDPETNVSTIYEINVKTGRKSELGNVMDFQGVLKHFGDPEFIEVKDWRILHLQYGPDGSKIAFRMDVGPYMEKYKHLVTMDINGDNVHYFGPKPMHFGWYDNESIMGHDNQIADGNANNNSLRRWDQDGKFIETLAGPGNHLGATVDRHYFGSESWYGESPIIIRVFRKNQLEPIWQDIASNVSYTTWKLAYHTNPSFSRDGKRVYYNKCVAPGKVMAYMAILPIQ